MVNHVGYDPIHFMLNLIFQSRKGLLVRIPEIVQERDICPFHRYSKESHVPRIENVCACYPFEANKNKKNKSFLNYIFRPSVRLMLFASVDPCLGPVVSLRIRHHPLQFLDGQEQVLAVDPKQDI